MSVDWHKNKLLDWNQNWLLRCGKGLFPLTCRPYNIVYLRIKWQLGFHQNSQYNFYCNGTIVLTIFFVISLFHYSYNMHHLSRTSQNRTSKTVANKFHSPSMDFIYLNDSHDKQQSTVKSSSPTRQTSDSRRAQPAVVPTNASASAYYRHSARGSTLSTPRSSSGQKSYVPRSCLQDGKHRSRDAGSSRLRFSDAGNSRFRSGNKQRFQSSHLQHETSSQTAKLKSQSLTEFISLTDNGIREDARASDESRKKT